MMRPAASFSAENQKILQEQITKATAEAAKGTSFSKHTVSINSVKSYHHFIVCVTPKQNHVPPLPPPFAAAAAAAAAAAGKKYLDSMKDDGEAIRKASPKSERLQPYRSQYLTLCKDYVDTMKEHQKAKEQMRKTQDEMMIRRGVIACGGTKTEAEVKEAMKADPENFLSQALIGGQPALEAQQALSDAQSRARDVEQLIRSIQEVAEMFNDLAALVQNQSAMLDTIENNVENAEVYVRKGNDNLKGAIQSQKKSRKCFCCMIVCGIIVAIALVAGLGGGLTGAFGKA
jgi:t-SNARE complex subunit (syntaxin)